MLTNKIHYHYVIYVFVNCVIRVAGRELVYHTISVRTIAFKSDIDGQEKGKETALPPPPSPTDRHTHLKFNIVCTVCLFHELFVFNNPDLVDRVGVCKFDIFRSCNMNKLLHLGSVQK